MALDGVADVVLRKDRREQVGIVCRGKRPAMGRLAGQRLCGIPCRLPGLAQPQPARAGPARAPGQTFRQGKVMGDMVLQGPCADIRCRVDHRGDPVCPAGGIGIALPAGPVPQGRTIGKGGPAAAQPQFQIAGQAQMVAPVCAGCGQRMLQQRQQGLWRQGAAEQRGHMAQQAARGRQCQRRARAVIGDDTPAVQRGRHLTRQHPVRRDQGNGPPLLRSLTQDQRNRRGFCPWPGRFDQRQMGCDLAQVGQGPPFGQPLVGDRCRAQGQRHKPVDRPPWGGFRP